MSVLREHKRKYLRSGGTEGHIIDMREMGGPFLATHCLIRYTGRRSGRTRVTPLFYGCLGGEVIVVASMMGAQQHPKWYLNIRESDSIDFQIAIQAYRATWREPSGAEREKVWSFMVDNLPSYAEYQKKTERQFPLVMMNAIEPIPVFTEADLT